MEYEEHDKRAWSVDFSRTEPSMLVSGSDDCKVLDSHLTYNRSSFFYFSNNSCRLLRVTILHFNL